MANYHIIVQNNSGQRFCVETVQHDDAHEGRGRAVKLAQAKAQTFRSNVKVIVNQFDQHVTSNDLHTFAGTLAWS